MGDGGSFFIFLLNVCVVNSFTIQKYPGDTEKTRSFANCCYVTTSKLFLSREYNFHNWHLEHGGTLYI